MDVFFSYTILAFSCSVWWLSCFPFVVFHNMFLFNRRAIRYNRCQQGSSFCKDKTEGMYQRLCSWQREASLLYSRRYCLLCAHDRIFFVLIRCYTIICFLTTVEFSCKVKLQHNFGVKCIFIAVQWVLTNFFFCGISHASEPGNARARFFVLSFRAGQEVPSVAFGRNWRLYRWKVAPRF